MGLDNGFVLRRRSDPNFSLELASFRKFYELDAYLASVHDVEVSEEKLESLINFLQPVIDTLRIYTDSELNYLEDNNSWPESLARELYGNAFSPTTRDTSYLTWRKAYKTRKLYMNLVTIRDMMSELCWTEEAKKDYYIEFYSSY